MIYLLAVLDFWDYFVVWIIVMIFGGAYAAKSSGDSRQLKRIESKLDSLLTKHGIDPEEFVTDELSDETKATADRGEKLAAIKQHREETGLDLATAQKAVEEYLGRNQGL